MDKMSTVALADTCMRVATCHHYRPEARPINRSLVATLTLLDSWVVKIVSIPYNSPFIGIKAIRSL